MEGFLAKCVTSLLLPRAPADPGDLAADAGMWAKASASGRGLVEA